MARSSPQRKTPIRGQTKSGFRESRHYPRGLIGTAKQRKALSTQRSIWARCPSINRLRSGFMVAVTTCCFGTSSPSTP